MTGPLGMRRKGFALILVLWTLVLIALVIAQLDASGRSEAKIAINLRENARAQAAADGAVAEAAFRLLDYSPQHWPADGATHVLVLPSGKVTVRIESESGKIEVNSADPALIAALIQLLGESRDRAATLADCIADWRDPGEVPRPHGAKLPQYRSAGLDYGPPDQPFQTLEELNRVLGMTPDLAAKMIPHITLYAFGQPDPTYADPVVLQAMQRVGMVDLSGQPGAMTAIPFGSMQLVTVTAEAVLTTGGRFRRHATLRVGGMFAHGYQILVWDSLPSS